MIELRRRSHRSVGCADLVRAVADKRARADAASAMAGCRRGGMATIRRCETGDDESARSKRRWGNLPARNDVWRRRRLQQWSRLRPPTSRADRIGKSRSAVSNTVSCSVAPSGAALPCRRKALGRPAERLLVPRPRAEGGTRHLIVKEGWTVRTVEEAAKVRGAAAAGPHRRTAAQEPPSMALG